MKLVDADKIFQKVKGSTASKAVKCLAEVLVATAPAVDAVVVTRCKDCKHYRQPSDCGLFEGLVESSPEAFCSYGEPREDVYADDHD